MAREIERKFLVRDPRILDGRQGERIIQGYLAKESGSMSTRVRIRGNRAYLTLKSPKIGYGRDEFEYVIPLADGEAMIANHCAGRIVNKTRYLVDHAPHVFEVDVFEGSHAGLIVAEVELPHEHTVVRRPEWLGDEVTGDSRYSNFVLAMIESGQPLANLQAATATGRFAVSLRVGAPAQDATTA
ncbi:MAG: CYTH domain-containing protein [Thauera sp.]